MGHADVSRAVLSVDHPFVTVPDPNMIDVEQLTKRYGAFRAVDRLTFSVGRGEIVGFLGPNGAGKTTTMRILTTFLPPTSGRARLAGHDVLDEPLEVRSNVGYLPENVPLYPEMRVREYLAFRARLKDVPLSKRRVAIDGVLGACRLREVETRIIGQLSKGYRQRVGLAEALVHDPDILILDEPTVGLDPIQIREVRALIRELGQRHTILLSTHIMQEVEAVCGRVLMIVSGRIALDDKLDHVRSEVAIVLEVVGGPVDTIRRALETTDGVARVVSRRTEGDATTFEVIVRDGAGPARGSGPPRDPERLGAAAASVAAVVAGGSFRPGREGRVPGSDRTRRTREDRGRLTMRHVPSLMRRELGSYFLGPMAYLILLAFQVIAWLNFWQLVDLLGRPQIEFSGLRDPMNTYISGSTPFWIAMLVAVPALTMRLLAEERRSGTIETLLTAPVTETEVVVAKWLAGVVMYGILLLPFLLYLPFLRHFGEFPFDLGPLAALLIGLTTIGMMFVSIGLFFSALTKNQIIAAIGTFVVLFLIVLLTMLAYSYAMERREPWAEAVRFVALLYQVHAFGNGQLDLRFLGLHLSVTAFMLFLTVKVLQLRQGN